MGKFSVVGYLFFFLYLGLLTLSLFSYIENTQLETESLRLAAIVNNATDSAVIEAVTSENLSVSESNIRPYFASDTFFSVFMGSYNISNTEENRVKCYDYVPLLALIADDGIYLGYPRIVDGWKYEFHWDPKIPFTAIVGGEIINMTISNDNKTKINIADGTFTDVQSEIATVAGYRQKISDQIVSAVTMAITKANEVNSGWRHKFYIPAGMAEYSVVDVHGVTMLAFVQNVDIYTREKLSYFAVGGTQTTRADKVVGYIKNGKRMYCYTNELNNITDVNVIKVFDDVWDAAAENYEPDLARMR